MTSWAKNQIAKHLARFARNVDPSQISLKFLRGEGELLNLELNEQVLSDLLELPPWLQLTKATCNRISAKIHWTSLKTDPIRLYLDCVQVEIIASEVTRKKGDQPPAFNRPQKEKTSSKPSKYGFAEKVADGMYVSINTVMALFKSVGFKATFSMSRIIIQSTAPDWTVPNNLRKTRIKDDQRGQVLIFKEIRWGTLKLDADASYREGFQIGSTPLRLITNNSAVHITIKKRLSDCGLVSSRLEVILDDILWVLTQSQLLKLSSFVHYLLKLRQKHLPLSTSEVDRTASNSPTSRPPPQAAGYDRQFQGQGGGSSLNQEFTMYDVAETSYHVKTKRIDLHLCDDKALDGQIKPAPPRTVKGIKRERSFTENGGALQITFSHLCIDHYPYHIAGVPRTVWRAYDDALFARRQWAQQLLDNFMKHDGRRANMNPMQSTGPNKMQSRRPAMFESFFLVSAQKFEIMEVTTTGREEPKPFLGSDKESLFLPEEMNAFFLDYTTYYYMGGLHLPVPAANLFLQLNPIQLRFHPLTCVWLNKFAQSVMAGLEWTKEFLAKEIGPPEHLDIRVEALMPKVVIPCEPDPLLPHMEERPKALQLTISQAVITNCRIGSVSSQSELLMDLQTFLASKLYSSTFAFPNENNDLRPLPNNHWVNDYSLVHRTFQNVYQRKREQMKNGVKISGDTEIPYHIWCIWCEQLWIDFICIENSKGRPVTFVDAVPIRLWLCIPVPTPGLDESNDTLDAKFRKQDSTPPSMKNTLLEMAQRTATPESYDDRASSRRTSKSSLTSSNTSLNSPRSDKEMPFEGPLLICSDQPGRPLSTASDSSLVPNNVSSPLHRCLDTVPPTSHTQLHTGLHPLRSSYSESNLRPGHINDTKFGLNETTSLKDFSLDNSMVNPSAQLFSGAGPPPPYSPESPYRFHSPRSASDKMDSQASRHHRASSITSLPPAYDVAASEAPPLPQKIPTGSDLQALDAVLNYFTNDTESKPKDSCKYPTVSGLLAIPKTAFLQMDHFQLLFLLRVQEMFAEVGQKISEDSEKFSATLSNQKDTVSSSFLLHLAVPSAEISVILPPCQGVQEDQRMSLMERIKEGKITKLLESLELNESDKMTTEPIDSSEKKAAETNKRPEPYSNKKDDVSNCCNEIDDSSGISSSSGSPPASANNWAPPSVPSSSCTIVNDDTTTDDPKDWILVNHDVVAKTKHNNTKTPCDNQEKVSASAFYLSSTSSSESDLEKAGTQNVGGAEFCLSSTASKEPELEIFIKNPDTANRNSSSNSSAEEGHVMFDDSLPKSANVRSSSEAKEAVNMIDSIPNSSADGDRLNADGYRVISSDVSTQTESDIPTGSDTFNRDRSLSLVSSASANDRLVSVVCIKLSNVKVGVQSENEDNLIKVTAGEIQLKERDSIKYSATLGHKLNSSSEDDGKMDKADFSELTSNSSVKVRMVTGMEAEALLPGAAELGFANIEVSGLDTSLLLSNVESLGQFAEDEFLMYTLPFIVELKDCDIKLLDDKPRRYLSTPLPPPLEVCIDSLTVRRSIDGKIQIVAMETPDQRPDDTTMTKNSNLPSNSVYSGTDSGGSRLDELENENERLIEDLKVGNARMLSLEQERDSLLKVLEKLQQELMWSNNENDKLQSRIRAFQQYIAGHHPYNRR